MPLLTQGLFKLSFMVTIFKNIRDINTPFHKDLSFVLERIRTGTSKDLVAEIRKEGDKSKRNEIKKQLPAICFSGTFSKRSDDSLIKHSGLICLDFDGYETKEQMEEERKRIVSDSYVLSAFTSPSGNGLKVIVKIPDDSDNHKRYFDALGQHFDSKHFDVSTKNVSRVCYESYDPDIYVNADADVWEVLADYEYRPVDVSRGDVTIPITDENKIVEILLKWWQKKYPMIEGQRNNNAFILAAALNEYGINKSLANYVLTSHACQGFGTSEIKSVVDSAYRNTSAFGTKQYEDESKLHHLRNKINNGESIGRIKAAFTDVDEDVVESVVKKLERDSSIKKFWNKSEKGAVSVIHFLFKEFLQHNGFYKFSPHNSMKYIFVKVTNNLIDKTTEEEIKDFVLGYLQNLDDLSIYNYFADKTRLFKEDFLSLLDTVDVHFVQDSKTFSFIYFRNCALKVFADRVETVDYIDLDGYVWRDQVIDRDFDECDSTACDFKTFVSNISGENPDRILALETAIGFLMSGYKDPGFCPSVILNDEVITDNPEGGTGKGLFVQGISMMKKVAMIDGKSFSFDKSFAYQTITTDTQIISFDDVKKSFNFERLFSAITEGITIEKKNKDAIRIPFKFSPKIVITTNYTIKGTGNSFRRRKFELELKQYYSKDYTPLDEFGKRLFDDWDETEWCAFDNYMVQNLMKFLDRGLVEVKSSNTDLKRLSSETCHEFIEWLGLINKASRSDIIKENVRILTMDLYYDFLNSGAGYTQKGPDSLSNIAFNKWLVSYKNYEKKYDVQIEKGSQGKWMMLKQLNGAEKKQDEEAFDF
jgi:acetolactate synthase small subunit